MKALPLAFTECVTIHVQRLIRDFKKLQNDPPIGVNASPMADNVLMWNAVIFGPDGTTWEDGIFRLTLEFSEEYPNKAPVVKFKTFIFHPNGEHPSKGDQK